MTYTLVADGTSDRVLLPILTWSLKQHGADAVIPQWADQSRIPRATLRAARFRTILGLYPCDLLFVHRDSEGQLPEARRQEIAASLQGTPVQHVPVVPVRMTEAWLLWNEPAIRCAAGNPNGNEPLDLPDRRRLEDLPDPKQVLLDILNRASGLNARRRSRMNLHERVHLIPNYIDDYAPLMDVPAFVELQRDIEAVLRRG